VYNSPLSPDRAERLIGQLNLAPGNRVLDIGCGDGLFLLNVVARYQAFGIGVDNDPSLTQEAQESAAQRNLESLTRFLTLEAAAYVPETLFDLILCIGSEFTIGGYESLLKKMRTMVDVGGLALVGTVVWKRPPSEEYLRLMNGENPYHDYITTFDLAEQQGWLVLEHSRSNEDEWDSFEGKFTRARYLKLLQNPDDPNFEAGMARMRAWQRGYLTHGRDTMGFCFFLLRKMPSSWRSPTINERNI